MKKNNKVFYIYGGVVFVGLLLFFTFTNPLTIWLWKEEHIRHYHVNDYGGGYMDWNNLKVLQMGKGHIDFGRFFRFVGETGYSGNFTFEGTGFDMTGAVNISSLNEQFALARKYLNQV